MLLFSAGIQKMLVRIDNQKQSDLGLCCLSWPFWQATTVQNFRASTEESIALGNGLN